MQYQDTYYFSFIEAKKEAIQHNVSNYNLQICYYDGEKVDTSLINLIHLPYQDIVNVLGKGNSRIPTLLSFDGIDKPYEEMVEIAKNTNLLFEQAKVLHCNITNQYIAKIKNNKPNFKQKLRFYLAANNTTKVMSNVSKNIVETLKNNNCEVKFLLDYGCDFWKEVKVIAEYNPHIIININHLNNGTLNEDIYNIIWIQDFFAIKQLEGKKLRKRDFIFSLIPEFDAQLDSLGITCQRQSFCVNNEIFKVDTKIEKKKKIVFIGSSYRSFIDFEKYDTIIQELTYEFENGRIFNEKYLKSIGIKYSLNPKFIEEKLLHYIIRDISVLNLCNINTNYVIEIYGRGWDEYSVLKNFCKGEIKYGEEISKIYNSATYALCPHPLSILQQRTFESSASGAIPLVYDCRELTTESTYEEAVIYFRTTNDLEKILQNDNIPKKDFTNLLEENSYKHFITKILDIVKEDK